MFIVILILHQWMFPKNLKSRVSSITFKMFLNSIYTELLIGKSFRNSLYDAKENLAFEDKNFINKVDVLIKDIHFQRDEIKAWTTFS